ncbi:MAG: hypothetical protein SH850_24840 [Planctomycetaceae bacterium]|nr:hypothetical protein [Planctomycetaceae bacterium]
MTDEFIPFCEELWRSWLSNKLDLEAIRNLSFDLEAAPEPYISFDDGGNPLVALTTNPGASIPQQQRASVRSASGPLDERDTYALTAKKLGAFYAGEHAPISATARQRIRALNALARDVGLDGVLQVEACPFHSPTLSMGRKRAMLKIIQKGGFLSQYTERLQAFLQGRTVVIVSAVSSRESLKKSTSLSDWVRWKASIAGLDLNQASFLELVKNPAGKTTAAAHLTCVNGISKVLVLMMGGNHLPAETGGLKTLAESMQLGRKSALA